MGKTMKSNDAIMSNIDGTIDQLIQNAEILSEISADSRYESETLALKKTQESLLAHLIHLDQYLSENRITRVIKEKENALSVVFNQFIQLEEIDASLVDQMKSSHFSVSNKPKTGRKRTKKRLVCNEIPDTLFN